MRRERNAAICILILGAAIAALFSSGRLILNTTASVPIGLWWRVDGPLNLGDVVRVPIEAFKATDWVPEEKKKKNAWGNHKAFLKRVAGLPGDLIEVGDYGLLRINGHIIPNSAPLSADRAGRPLKAYPLPVRLESDELWLLSDSPRGFDSRYLGPVKYEKCNKLVLLPWLFLRQVPSLRNKYSTLKTMCHIKIYACAHIIHLFSLK